MRGNVDCVTCEYVKVDSILSLFLQFFITSSLMLS